MAQQINVYVDLLVFEGLNLVNIQGTRRAFETELKRLITESGMRSFTFGPADISGLIGEDIKIGKNTDAETIGTGVAKSVYSGTAR